MIKNLFVEAKNPLQAAPCTPGGEPVNYVHPPTIDVDMFTDLVYQHTHTHTHNWSTLSVLTGADIICVVWYTLMWPHYVPSLPSGSVCTHQSTRPPVGSLTLRWASLQDPAGLKSTSFLYGMGDQNSQKTLM